MNKLLITCVFLCPTARHPRRLYPSSADHDGSDFLGLQLIKVQDTIPIHSAIMSQKVALGTLKYGEQYTEDKIATLQANRQAALTALEPLGTLGDGVWGGDAIYLFARLPEGVKWNQFFIHFSIPMLSLLGPTTGQVG